MKKFGTVIIFAFIFITAVMIGYVILKPDPRLPIYQPGDINPALVDESVMNNQDHHISPFTLINQNGDTITEAVVEGKIYVACFFFTRCATICPKLSSSMQKLQSYYSLDDEPILISHSVTPVMDSVPLLANYAEQYGADANRWHLVTGDKRHIYDLARKSYFAVLDEGDGGIQDFIHTENMVMVDREGRLRGYYDGTSTEQVNKLIVDLEILRSEYE